MCPGVVHALLKIRFLLHDLEIKLSIYIYSQVLCMFYRLDSDDIEPIAASAESNEPLWKRNDPNR